MSFFNKIFAVIFIISCFWMVHSNLAKALTAPQSTVVHKTFMGNEELNLYPWAGNNVALLTPTNDLDLSAMTTLLSTLDKAWDYYKNTTGKSPITFYNYNGLTSIASVPSTCGAGCGYLGWQGIELMNSTFDTLYTDVKDRNKYDQAVFYEMGRNFWLYDGKLNYVDGNSGGIITGYAIFMRFLAMESAGAEGVDFGDIPFEIFKNNIIQLIDEYEQNSSATWENVFWVDKPMPNQSFGGAGDLFASLCFRLMRDYGDDEFINKLWKEVDKRPARATTQDAVDNFVIAASIAANKDLSDIFSDKWRWPVSDKARNEISLFFNPLVPINGFCGVDNGPGTIKDYCSVGTAFQQTLFNGHYWWKCQGSNGGSDTDWCRSVPLPIDGQCNNSIRNSCSFGDSNDNAIEDTATEWKWRCDGKYGGNNSVICFSYKPEISSSSSSLSSPSSSSSSSSPPPPPPSSSSSSSSSSLSLSSPSSSFLFSSSRRNINQNISKINHVPVFRPIGDKKIEVEAPLIFSIKADDKDNNALIYDVSSLPDGAKFYSNRRIFSWTPQKNQTGNHSVTFSVIDDSGKIDSRKININVFESKKTENNIINKNNVEKSFSIKLSIVTKTKYFFTIFSNFFK